MNAPTSDFALDVDVVLKQRIPSLADFNGTIEFVDDQLLKVQNLRLTRHVGCAMNRLVDRPMYWIIGRMFDPTETSCEPGFRGTRMFDPTETYDPQRYYWSEEWQKGEQETLLQLRAGKGIKFDDVRAALDWLDE